MGYVPETAIEETMNFDLVAGGLLEGVVDYPEDEPSMRQSTHDRKVGSGASQHKRRSWGFAPRGDNDWGLWRLV